MEVRNKTIAIRILIIELVVNIILAGILLSVLPSIFYSAVRVQVQKSAETIGEQALEGIDSLMKELYHYSYYINSDSSFRKLLYQREDESVSAKLQNAFSNMYFIDNSLVIAGMIIYDDGTIIKSYGVSDADMSQLDASWYQDIKTNSFTNQFHITYNENKEVDKFYYIQHFDNMRGGSANVFLICTFLPFEQYLSAIESGGGSYVLLDRDLDSVYPNEFDAEWIDTITDKMKTSKIYNKDVIENNQGVSIVYKTSLGGGHLLVNMSRETLLSPYKNTIRAIMVAFILFFLTIQMIIVFVLFRSLRPIHTLATAMQKVAAGDLSVRASISSGDEIEMLGNSFNNMTVRLKENMDMLFEKERIQQKMKYSLLISQIDPHFIYNTMNSITYLAKHGKTEDIIVVNRKLIDILKDTLKISGIDFYDTIGQEVEIVNSYIVIQRYRYGDCFEVRWDIPDDMTDVLTAKNIIQPIVENALFHGLLTNKDEDGTIIGGLITISVKREDDFIVISVSDSGKGIGDEKAAAFNRGESAFDSKKGEHIGLNNIRERLKYLFKDEFEMRIDTSENEGTTVTIRYRELKNFDEG